MIDLSWFGLVVVAFASYRITRVITTDTLLAAARERLYRWAWVEPDEPELYAIRRAEHPVVGFGHDDEANPPMPRNGGLRTYVNELFNCPWCMGVWISYAVLAFWCWVVRDGVAVAAYLVLGAAVAGAQGWLQSREG